MNIVSLFSGAGGMDLGFTRAGFNVVWANEYDKTIWDTYRYNHPLTQLDTRSITQIPSSDIPEAVGLIGGPPCQSWSEAGSRRGMDDHRGQLFWEYIRVLNDKQPLFFLAENVSGILQPKHDTAFKSILHAFEDVGYQISYQLLNAKHYNVPQDRERMIVVGYRKDLNLKYTFPKPHKNIPVLKDTIWDLQHTAKASLDNKHTEELEMYNHEYFTGGFSYIYMSRNRVRAWDETSFTIQASGRHAPLHPQAPKMLKVGKDEHIFMPEYEHLYRRLSVRECARIQTFPDDFIFKYHNLNDGYKMIGNAVPVNFAQYLANQIHHDLLKADVLHVYA